MTRLSTLADPKAAAEYVAHEIAHALEEALVARGVAHFALAGGNTPRPAYELLAGLLEDWSAVELWYGDERCVNPDDPDSNHRLVVDSLLAHIPARGASPAPALNPTPPARVEQSRRPERVGALEHRIPGELGPEAAALNSTPPARVEQSRRPERVGPLEHRIPGELGPEAAARASAAELCARVAPAKQGGLPVLDVALLGIGEDGHTASLFPGNPAVEDSSGALCLPVYGAPKPPPERVTLSLPVLRAARHCLLLVTGAGKADALAGALAGPNPRIPASLLASERLHVVADRAAAPG